MIEPSLSITTFFSHGRENVQWSPPHINWGIVLPDVLQPCTVSEFTPEYVDGVIEDSKWCDFWIRYFRNPSMKQQNRLLRLRWAVGGDHVQRELMIPVHHHHTFETLGAGRSFPISYRDFQDILWTITFSDIV